MRIDAAVVDGVPFGVDTPEDLARARAMLEQDAMIETAANRIAFQGTLGANSHIACRQVYPDMQALPCATFEDSFAAVRDGGARLAMIPIDNSVAGRVADIHHLLPHSGLYIIGEHFQRVEHCLLGTPDAEIGDLKEIHSHIHALDQCRKLIAELGVEPAIHFDTAGAAPRRRAMGRQSEMRHRLVPGGRNLRPEESCATRSRGCGPQHDPLHHHGAGAADARCRQPQGDHELRLPGPQRAGPRSTRRSAASRPTISTSPQLESYIIDGAFTVAQFYADVEGHPDEQAMKWAFEELDFFTTEWTLLGTYPASPFRG